MKHEIPENDLQAFVDGQLSPRRHDEVIAHLGADPGTRRRVEVYMEHKRVLRERLGLAQMLYEDSRKHGLTLYLAPADDEAETDVQVVHVDGFTAGYWNEQSLTYTVVAETPDEQLLAIAMEIASQ